MQGSTETALTIIAKPFKVVFKVSLKLSSEMPCVFAWQ